MPFKRCECGQISVFKGMCNSCLGKKARVYYEVHFEGFAPGAFFPEYPPRSHETIEDARKRARSKPGREGGSKHRIFKVMREFVEEGTVEIEKEV